MNKVALIVLLVLVLGGGYWYMNKGASDVVAPAATTETAGTAGSEAVTPAETTTGASVDVSVTGTVTTPAAKTVTVSWKNDVFTPAEVTINAGDTVVFKNDGAKALRVASAPHPSHTSYPALDSGTLEAGKSFSLVFPSAVTVSYHNHLNPSSGGKVIVK